MKLIENGTNKVFDAQIMDDESFEIEALNLGVNDPCYALFRFQHADAPLPNVEATSELLNWYNSLCEEDSFDQPPPGEQMIGKTFYVMCWNSTALFGCNNTVAGKTYAVEVKDCHGFGTDGFHIEELGFYVDTATFAIQHFMIA